MLAQGSVKYFELAEAIFLNLTMSFRITVLAAPLIGKIEVYGRIRRLAETDQLTLARICKSSPYK